MTRARTNSALDKPVAVSDELADVLGGRTLPGPALLTRAMVTKLVWDYIKANGLQDPTDKRMIVADEKLSRIFGADRPRASMFEMTQLVNKHIRPAASINDSGVGDSDVGGHAV